MSKIRVLNLQYDSETMGQACTDVLNLARRGPDTGAARYVVTPNAEIAECCYHNQQLLEAVEHADYVLPDGIGVVLASRILGRPIKERLPGYDLARNILPLAAAGGIRLYLLGAAQGVAERAAERMKAENPGLVIAGTHHGYFQEDEAVIRTINEKKPDILFVALGFPRQEIWMYRNRSRIQAGVMLGLGGSLDVFAGVAKRAPALFIRLNLEWLYRLLRQPWRFIRMLSLPRYILRALYARFLGKRRAE